MPPARGRTAANDLRTKDRTISREVQQAEKPIEFWHIMFTEEMLDLIVLHTNEKIQGQINDRIQETGSDEFIKKTAHLKLLDKVIFLFFVFLSSSVPVPNPDPPDPHVFGPPGSGSTCQSFGSGSGFGSFYHHAKIVRKTLIPTIL